MSDMGLKFFHIQNICTIIVEVTSTKYCRCDRPASQ